jgi:outer membrane receptor protein involved in Fe transport
MQNFPRSILGAAIAAILAAPSVTLAQSADATLRGRAPADTDVTARNIATGSTRRAHSSSDGSYTIAGLPPGTYKVDAGPGTETTVTVTVASTATLNLGGAGAAAPEAPLQEVTVTGRRLREVKTSEVGTTVSQQQIETTPQMTRNFLEFADAVPGVQFTVDASGHTKLSGGAQNENGVNVYIDGVGQKGYVRSGLAGQTGDTQGNPFPQLAIGEYKVITSNYKAEYDQISSAAITAVTRSGTNSFEGQAFGTYSSDNWRARTPGERANDSKTESETKEYGLSFGGPILQDKMHFFLTYEAKRYETPTTVLASGTTPDNVVAALPQNALDQLGPASIGFDEDLFFAKIDFEPSDSDRFELSAKIRDETADGTQVGTGTAASAAVNTDNTDKRWELSWKHSGDSWFNEVQATYEDTFFVPHVVNGGQSGSQFTYYSGFDANILAIDGSDPRAGQNKGQKGWALANNITFTDIHGAGDHTIKAGIKYKQVDLTATDAEPGQPVFFYNVTAAGTDATPWKAAVALPVPGFPSVAKSADKQLGLYIQDDWEVNDHLTWNLGVRWDFEKNPSYLDEKTPDFVIAAMNTVIDTTTGLTYGQSLGLSSDPHVGYNINDYISHGNERKADKNQIQPRLGFSYDIGGDQEHVFFGGAGRAYDRTLYDYLQLEQTKFALATTDVQFNAADGIPSHACTVNGTTCRTWDPAFLTDQNLLIAPFNGSPGEINLINNNLKTPFSDQFSLGMRNRLGDWNTSVALARINSKNGFVFTLGNRYPDGEFWENRSQPWGNPPPGLGNLIIGNSGIETKSTQLLLSAEKPFTEESKWGASVAYTYTDAMHNRDINEHYAFDQSSIKEYKFIRSNAAPKHRLVATGSYQLPWGILLASKLTYSTPDPHNVNSCLSSGSFPNGANCEPFSYTVGFSDGYKALDLQVTKNFELGAMGSMYVRLDMLNVTNEDNLVDYTDTTSGTGLITGGHLSPDGNITGFPRTLRASFGLKF